MALATSTEKTLTMTDLAQTPKAPTVMLPTFPGTATPCQACLGNAAFSHRSDCEVTWLRSVALSSMRREAALEAELEQMRAS